MFRALVGLGSNLGDSAAVLAAAVTALGDTPGVVVQATSSWHQTAPVGGPPGQTAFLNGAALMETLLEPEALLDTLQRIETASGRRRDSHWGPRTLDLDLLLYDQRVIDSPRLVVPHPWLAVRRFVLAPAVEIAAEWLHPVLRWSLERLLAHLDTAPNYLALCGVPGAGKSAAAEQLAAFPGIHSLLATTSAEITATAALGDPAGLFWRTEIEFLAKRQQSLAGVTRDQTQGWTVSDFWIGQGLAYAALQLSADELARYRELWQAADSVTMAPKLLVWLDPVQERTFEQDRSRNRIEEVAMQPDRGPMLRLRELDSAAVVAKLKAAIDAMQ